MSYNPIWNDIAFATAIVWTIPFCSYSIQVIDLVHRSASPQGPPCITFSFFNFWVSRVRYKMTHKGKFNFHINREYDVDCAPQEHCYKNTSFICHNVFIYVFIWVRPCASYFWNLNVSAVLFFVLCILTKFIIYLQRRTSCMTLVWHYFLGVVEFGRVLQGDSERYMEGNLDEFVVFNEELSANEIALLANV